LPIGTGVLQRTETAIGRLTAKPTSASLLKQLGVQKNG